MKEFVPAHLFLLKMFLLSYLGVCSLSIAKAVHQLDRELQELK